MMRVSFLMLLALIAACLPARAAELDPEGLIRPALLERALEAMNAQGQAERTSGKLVVVDYSLHSSSQRLFVINLETGAVSTYRTAHGLGSDPDHDGYLDSFSSQPGSQASPEGSFRLAEPYQGRHGPSFRLDGQDETNRNARLRAIVVHSAWYAEPDFLDRHGKLGRSSGCIVFSKADLARFAVEVPVGTLIFVGR
jgi:hypothetical protein